MKNLKIEINFEDLVSDMFVDADYAEFGASPSLSFQDCLKQDIVGQISRQIITQIKDEAKREVATVAGDLIKDFVDVELSGIITRKLRAGEIRTGYNGFMSFDQLIEKSLSSQSIERQIEMHIESKAKEFGKEMKARYDNIFAAKIVNSLKEQKMLSPDIAKILLGDE